MNAHTAKAVVSSALVSVTAQAMATDERSTR